MVRMKQRDRKVKERHNEKDCHLIWEGETITGTGKWNELREIVREKDNREETEAIFPLWLKSIKRQQMKSNEIIRRRLCEKDECSTAALPS